MKVVIGLGNIGEKYCFTRHNAGFMVLDKLALAKGTVFKEDKKLKSLITRIRLNDEDIILAKPVTFMNLSGEATSAITNYFKIPPEDILIVYDDIAIELGRLRFRKSGSDGGHNGIKSIIQHLGTSDFARLKVGIGPQPSVPSETFVLQNFSQQEKDLLKEVLTRAVSAVEFYQANGIEKSQNTFN